LLEEFTRPEVAEILLEWVSDLGIDAYRI